MQQLLIIVGIIIILSFITGIVLTVKENKSISKEVLTDDPKILFNDYESKVIDKVDENVQTNEIVNNEKQVMVEKVSDSEGFDLPTNHDYNSDKFVVSSIKNEEEVVNDAPPIIEENIVVENKNSSRFIYTEEEVI